ncbi:AraC family transcriptional regulator [Chitinophaga qingshengii]|uniref:Helix-turn-helix domain-containing protein n=1 Tax=Chitinophaga qingshengii TaxID=1569794 RepID=A0ABR7TWR7_9BACT|nr:helix-turn-helix transcriptional regulator [Chitinophaga qingshengii]MBC9934927.1 helix-turn-helix domain-containing protein [Chitinophaga qingshengii]
MVTKLQIKDKSESGKSIKIAPFKKEIRKTTPHKHNNYFEILYLSQGSGQHFIDSRKFEVAPPVMYFIRKDQVHYWELDSEPDGFVIIIKKSFIEDSLDSELKALMTQISRESCIYPEQTAAVHSLFELLTQTNKREGKYAFHIIEGLLKALLALVLEDVKPMAGKMETSANLYHSFLALLNSEQTVKNKVHYYAEQLSTSPQNLSAACRKAVNQPAEDILAEFIVSEAKRQLIYTDNTIAEISFVLDFHDPSHFVKYFKRKTGQTPLAFRKNN